MAWRSYRLKMFRLANNLCKLTILRGARLVGVYVLRFGLFASRHGATIRRKEFQNNFPPLLQQTLQL